MLIHGQYDVDAQVMLHVGSRTMALIAVMPACDWSEVHMHCLPFHSDGVAACDTTAECLPASTELSYDFCSVVMSATNEKVLTCSFLVFR